MLKRTALFEEHRRLGGKLIDFGGWELPVQYSGVLEEHLACRSSVGLFDVSHMGEIHLEGADSEAFLNYVVTNDVSRLAIHQAQYTVMCHEQGGIVDDLVIYRRAQDRFLLVVNAANTEKDYAHLLQTYAQVQSNYPSVKLSNESAQYSQIALQGRNAAQVLAPLTRTDLHSIQTYWFAEGEILGIPALIARTGYTGEDGFELYVAWDQGPKIWRALEEQGKPFGLKPCGLGARDTLRLEMKYPLYGNELNDQTLPLEVGLSWVFKANKGNFLGKAKNLQAKEAGLKHQLVGLRMLERGIPRHGYRVYTQGGERIIGEITSGTQSPSLKQAIGLAWVQIDSAKIGTKVAIEIRGTQVPAEIIPTPFYKRPY
ncbi:MAG: glycine cleavage system aminomethyltransferase GcvT [Bdellovibrionia bacterium]